MSHTHRQDITFGLELEFLTPSCDGYVYEDGPAYHAPTRKALALELRQLTHGLGIAAECNHDIGCFCAVCMHAPAKDVSPGMRVFNAGPSDQVSYVRPCHQFFLIQKEDLVSPQAKGPWRGIEITTPVFNMSELSAGLPQTKQVVSALRNMDLDIAANRSCGLHVHVGLRAGLRLTLAKKLVTLVMLMELPLILPLCPASRRESPFTSLITEKSRFVVRRLDLDEMASALRAEGPEMREHWPWTLGDSTATAWNGGDPVALQGTMRLIWHSRSLRELAEGLCKRASTRTALAIRLRSPDGVQVEPSSVDPDGNAFDFEGTQSTFEFRYPQMSFDMPFIKNWAELCCKLVEIATLDAPAFKAKLQGLVCALSAAKASGNTEWETILGAIGLGHQVPEWREQLRRHAGGEEISHLGEGGILLPE
ncbi:Uncharacterized protein TPAR_04290 [Tolypocladium paradoxum]|uniref:Amidoligase enzyme n=1 Tax=Tolypocladium paradoxum TaxID=94208 RepID=A0A2S4KZ94_9HYPO|nr:Uncharacterized protein TPAR_04290 [Tolypocladium paradoxum]